MKKYLVLATAVMAALMLVSLVPMNRVSAAAKADWNYVWYTGSDPAWSALQAGTVDMLDWSITQVQKTAAEGDANLQVVAYSENGMWELDLNNNYTIDDYPANLNPMYVNACRAAVARLTDKNYVISTILNFYGSRIDAPVGYPQIEGWVDPSVVTYDWNHNGVIEPSEDLYPYKYNPTEAAKLLASVGFNDTDGNGWLNYPNDPSWLGAAGIDTTAMPLEVCARSEDPNRLAVGQMIINALENALAAATWPAGYVGAGWYTTRTTWQQPRAVLSPKVMGAHNYHIYTGGWSFGRYPTYVFSFFNSLFWYSYGSNYVTGEGPWSVVQHNPANFAHPTYDAMTRGIYYAPTFAAAQSACFNATKYHVVNTVNIPLWSFTSYQAFRKGVANVIDMAGIGTRNDYTFLLAYKPGGVPINMGIPNTWGQMNQLYSQWYFEASWLDRMNGFLIGVNPYNLAIDVPWMAQDWQVGTWVDPIDGNTKSTCTYYLRKDIGCAGPENGTFYGNCTAQDLAFNLWYNYRYSDDWAWSGFMDMKRIEILNAYTVKVYFDDNSYWFYSAPTYPIVGPTAQLEPILCATTTTSFLGSDLVANGGQFEYQFTTEGVTRVISATKNGNPITEDVDFYVRGGYDLTDLRSVYVNLTNVAPTDTISITYSYAIAGGAGGTYLGSNLGYTWENTLYSYNTHYPVTLTSTASALNKNPYFFYKPITGETDLTWVWSGTTKPRSGYYQINILDVVKCTASYCGRGDGTYNPGYFPGADIDASDQCHIGILDLVSITGVYGQKWGTPPA